MSSRKGRRNFQIIGSAHADPNIPADYRLRPTHPNGSYWIPRNHGVPLSQIDTSPNFWWTNL